MSEWKTNPLRELAEISSGGTPSRAISEYWNGDIPWVTPTDITRCKSNYLKATQESISSLGLASSSAKLLPVGTLLLTSRATIGEVKILATPAATNQGFKNLIPGKKLLGEFLFYQLSRNRNEIERFAAGSTFLEINIKDTSRINVLYPENLFVQQKITYILQTIDQAIEKTEQLIEKYQQIKAGLMHDLFTRGIGADGQLRPLRGQAPELYQETPIGWIPKEWKVKTIDSLSAGYKGSTAIGPFGSDLVMTDYRNEGVPVVFVRDVKESGFKWVSDVYVSTEKAQLLNAHKVKPGDLLATKMGLPPCVACVYPSSMDYAIITADMIKMTPNTSEVDVYWLASALNNDRVRRQVAAITAGVTRPKITLADFRMLQIATPNLGEQRNIKKFIEAQEKLTELELQRLIVLRNQKSGLMHDLLTGKVPVSVDPLKVPLSPEQGAA